MTFEDILEHVDAHVFTGDTIHDKTMRLMFAEYIARWEREIAALNAQYPHSQHSHYIPRK